MTEPPENEALLEPGLPDLVAVREVPDQDLELFESVFQLVLRQQGVADPVTGVVGQLAAEFDDPLETGDGERIAPLQAIRIRFQIDLGNARLIQHRRRTVAGRRRFFGAGLRVGGRRLRLVRFGFRHLHDAGEGGAALGLPNPLHFGHQRPETVVRFPECFAQGGDIPLHPIERVSGLGPAPPVGGGLLLTILHERPHRAEELGLRFGEGGDLRLDLPDLREDPILAPLGSRRESRGRSRDDEAGEERRKQPAARARAGAGNAHLAMISRCARRFFRQALSLCPGSAGNSLP